MKKILSYKDECGPRVCDPCFSSCVLKSSLEQQNAQQGKEMHIHIWAWHQNSFTTGWANLCTAYVIVRG